MPADAAACSTQPLQPSDDDAQPIAVTIALITSAKEIMFDLMFVGVSVSVC